MAVTNFSAARRAGFKVTNKAVKDDAAIAMSKFGTRTLWIGLNPATGQLEGSSVASSSDGVFSVVTLPDANAGQIYLTTRLPKEWDSGTNVKINIYWKSANTTGDVRFSVDLAPLADNEDPSTTVNQTVTTTVNSTANKLNKSQVTFDSSNFSADDWLGIKIDRDPTHANDDHGADIKVAAVVVELTGRG